MVKVVGVKFKTAGKMYYFDPGNFDLDRGMDVIVETARGMEFGFVTGKPKEVPEEKIVAPLKPIIRVATDADRAQHEANEQKKERALAVCQEKIDKRNLDMKLIDVEYTFDNSKVIFYFASDGRVDFRELLKDLASAFRMRIELRQIGVRDESKMMGGIGCCGRPLCCNSWLTDFNPVSIKMAKVQNLSLNPTKISGCCGRLMCCLKYENDVYVEQGRGMPDVGEHVKTPDGMAVVTDTSVLEMKVKARLVTEPAHGEEPEKLSSDTYTYRKCEIQRLGKGHKKPPKRDDILEGLDAEERAEIQDLLKD